MPIGIVLYFNPDFAVAAKSARRADESPPKGFVGVNPDQNASHFASAEGKFCDSKIWVKFSDLVAQILLAIAKLGLKRNYYLLRLL